jgi:hypothetical protein
MMTSISKSVLVSICLALVGCSGTKSDNSSTSAPPSSVVVNPRLSFVDQLGGDTNVEVDSDHLVFPETGNAWLLQRQPGDALLCSFACPTSFLREVVSVADSGTSITVQTNPGNLTDVWSEGHNIDGYLVTKDDYLNAHPSYAKPQDLAGGFGTNGTFKVGPFSYPADMPAASLTGNGTYSVRFPFQGNWNKTSVGVSLGAEAILDIDAQLSLFFKGKIAGDDKLVLPMPALELGVFVISLEPPIPIFVSAQWEGVISTDVSGSLSIPAAKGSAHASYSAGVTFDLLQGTSLWKSTKVPDSFSVIGSVDSADVDPTVKTDGSIAGSAGILFRLNFAEPGGAGLDIETLSTLTFDAATYSDCSKKPHVGLNADLKSEIDLDVLTDVTFLGFTLVSAKKGLTLAKIPTGTIWELPHAADQDGYPLTAPFPCNCTINRVDIPDQTPNPVNACQVCKTEVNPVGWTSVPDSVPCPNGFCLNGACILDSTPDAGPPDGSPPPDGPPAPDGPPPPDFPAVTIPCPPPDAVSTALGQTLSTSDAAASKGVSLCGYIASDHTGINITITSGITQGAYDTGLTAALQYPGRTAVAEGIGVESTAITSGTNTATQLYCYMGGGVEFNYTADTLDHAVALGEYLAGYVRGFLP